MTSPIRSRAMPPTRRSFCLCCALAATGAASGGWLSPRTARAQAQGVVDRVRDAAVSAPIEVHRLRGGVSMLEGSGGNIAVLGGPDGKLLVDAGIAGSRPQLTAALVALGREPVRHLINTHWHFDHADGNAWLNADGATVTAHANTHRRLSTAQRVEDWNYDFPPAPPGALPTRIVTEQETMRVNGATLTLRHPGPAHTDTDLVVHFAEADILHAGDIFWNGVYPFIDHSSGGSIDGTIRVVDTLLRDATDRTIVIPGHGPPGDRRDLQAYRDMLAEVRSRVAALKRQGRSVAEAVAARPTADLDDHWGRFLIDGAAITRLAYRGV